MAKPIKSITINSTKYSLNSDGKWINLKISAGSPYTVTQIEKSENMDLTSYTMQDLMNDVKNGHLALTFEISGGDVDRYIFVADTVETSYNDDTHLYTYGVAVSGFTKNEGAGRFAYYIATRNLDSNELVTALLTKNQVQFYTGTITWN